LSASPLPQPIAIYVDADACPVKQEIYRVAERHALKGVAIKGRPYSVMAGLVPAIHVFTLLALEDCRRLISANMTVRSDERFIQIIPFRIHGVDKTNLPGAGPMFDGCLALNCRPNIVEVLHINQSFQAMTFGESIDQSLPMLESAPRQVAGDAGIQDAIAPIGHEINPAARHKRIKARRGWPEQVRP
jgi:hypothetical protein